MVPTLRALALLLCAAPAVAAAQDPPHPRPNLVLLLADDLAWNDLGCTGHGLHRTPHLDRLAREGTRFSAAYSNGPNCAPTRAALMSGLYAPRTGVYTVGSAQRGKSENRRLIPVPNRSDLPEEVATLAEVLRTAGYATAHVGKWHLGPDPRTHGFDLNVAGNARGAPRTYHSPYRDPDLPDGPEGEYLTDRLAAEAVAFLEAHARADSGRPFFLYLPFFSVHTPIQGRADLVERYRELAGEGAPDGRVAYAAMVGALDEALGRVLEALERLELDDRTLVVFTSDNGGHGVHADPRPLRGSKGMLYEGGVRVPLIARWPGRVRAGATSDVPAITLDLYPTLLAAAGVSLPEGVNPDGIDLIPVLEGGEDPGERALFWHFPAYLQAYGSDQGPWRTTPAGAVRVGSHKLIEFFEDGRRELYDLATDPGETRDLSTEEPELTERLAARLAAWRDATGAPVPREPNPGFRE